MKTLISQSTSSIYIGCEDRLKPLHMPVFASHNSYEIDILISGERNIFIGKKLFSAVVGDVSFIKPNVPHRSFGTAHKGIFIEVSPDYIEENFTAEEKGKISACFDKHIVRLPMAQIERIWSDEPYRIEKESEKKRYFLELIELLTQYLPDTYEEKLILSNDLSMIGNYIQEHYLEIQSLDEIAEHFGISKSYLCRIFKKHTGLTVITYLNSLKIQEASRLLNETDKSIEEICRLCGFKNRIYFTRTFKQFMELTPTEKRKKDSRYAF